MLDWPSVTATTDRLGADPAAFIVARNPDAGSTLPYLIRIPVEGGIWVKAREAWPRAARVYCHPAETPPDVSLLEIVDEAAVRFCGRRGPVVDLVLGRGINRRAQFVFNQVRGRRTIFWQTAKSAAGARPGMRVPVWRSPPADLVVEIDSRERYPYKFAAGKVGTVRKALEVGDYAVRCGDAIVAAVERKTLEDLAKGLSEGSLGFAMSHLATLRAAAVVVEGSYAQLIRAVHVRRGWLDELIARLQVRYPAVPIVFADSRKLAEHWTARFLAAAFAEFCGPSLRLEQTGHVALAAARLAELVKRKKRAKRPAGVSQMAALNDTKHKEMRAAETAPSIGKEGTFR